MLHLGLIGLGMLTAPLVPFVLVERRWRWRWREVEAGRTPAFAQSSLYREGASVPVFLPRAPAAIRWAAWSCFFFGQLFVPGLALGLLGLVFGGVGVVSIPGLIVAGRLWLAGLDLLRRSPRDAYWRTRSAASLALWLNGTIFGLSLLLALLIRPGWSSGFWPGFFFVNGYGLLSALQALALLWTTRRYEDALLAPTQALALGRRIYQL
jgi:hypothetical protein